MAFTARWSLLLLVLAPAFAQPVVTELQNNYSYTQPGLPNYGISPGMLFIIKGTGLGSITNTAEKFPLTTSLNGISVSVTVNGTTTQPTLYYILPTQIGAVLPEGTPLGSGTLTVSTGLQTSQAVPIQVVQSDFGILTYNGAGTGPAYAFDQNYNPITATYPATPGELIVFWGTGVGPDPANDDKTEPQQANNLSSVPMNVYIGGVQAQVFYKGRSAYPGVDEVFVYVPTGVPTGCYVSVVTQSGSITSNFTTIPVAASGSASCSDSVTVASDWHTLIGRTSTNVADLSVIGGTRQTGLGSQTISSATAQFRTDNASQIYSELFNDGFASVGSCIVNPPGSTNAGTPLSAGASLTLTGPGNEQAMVAYTSGANPPYAATLPAGFIPAGGGTFTFTGSDTGVGQVTGFTAAATVPAPVTWTNMSAASSIVASQGFTMTWTGGNPNNLVQIFGDSTGSAGLDVTFECIVPASPGSFTIPPQVLQSLPSTGPGATLGLLSLSNPISFPAGDLDFGFAYGGFETVDALANYENGGSAGPQISSLTLASSSVSSSGTVQGTVTLSGAAPAGGVAVALSASSTLVTIPATVTIPAGSASASFNVSAGSVTSAQTVTLAATYQGKFSTAMLTVNPAQAVSVFNGAYTGNYSGTGSVSGPVSGTVTATANNGVVTVTSPAAGSGTVAANGSATFGVVLAGGTSCTFTGTLVASGASVTGSGTFSCTGPTISGNWNVSLEQPF